MSDINTNGIDKDYPRPGEDNDSIGFRNNFSEIKNNLDTAKTELDDLQLNVARTDESTDFNLNVLSDLSLRNYSKTVYDFGNVSTNQTVDYSNGSYQTMVIDSDISVTLTGWPATDRFAVLKLQVSKNSQSTNVVTFDELEGQTIRVDASWPESFTMTDNEQPFVVQFSTYDNGENIYATYLGKYTTGFDSTIENNPFEVRDISVENDAIVNGDLTVNGVINFPDLELPANLDSLNDIEIDTTTLASSQILRYNNAQSQWENVDDPLSNVQIDNIADDQILRYDSTSGNWQNVDDPLSNLEITNVTDNQILRYESSSETWQNVDDPLSNVDIENPLNDQILRYNDQTENWENVEDPLLSSVNLTNLDDGEVLKFNSFDQEWQNESLKFQNVDTDSVSDKQILRYNNDTGNWENRDFGNLEEIAVTIADNGGQQEFRFDGQFLESLDFFWQVGTIYKFDVSDDSNVFGPLRFSTTPDTDVPDSITEYTDNVDIVGTAGNPGAYVQIKITQDTPTPLYLYGEKNDPQVNVSLLGRGADGDIDVGIKRKIGNFDTVKSDVAGENGDTLINYANSEVIGTQKPGELVIPVVDTAERDNLGGSSGVPFVGQLVFNTDEGSNGSLQIYVGGVTGWSTLAYDV